MCARYIVLILSHNIIIFLNSYRYKDSNKWQLFAGGDTLKGQSVKNIVPYPQVKYNQFLYNNDIVLIELEEPLVFSRNISAVCLPRQPIQVRIRAIKFSDMYNSHLIKHIYHVR